MWSIPQSEKMKKSICEQQYTFLARTLTFILFFTVDPFVGGMKDTEYIPLVFKLLAVS